MTFDDAIYMLKNNRTPRRRWWCPDTHLFCAQNGHIYLTPVPKFPYAWMPHLTDMLAIDWEEYIEPGKEETWDQWCELVEESDRPMFSDDLKANFAPPWLLRRMTMHYLAMTTQDPDESWLSEARAIQRELQAWRNIYARP